MELNVLDTFKYVLTKRRVFSPKGDNFIVSVKWSIENSFSAWRVRANV